jgi:flagella basal body P-ring formation protein FlgA
MKKMMIRAGLLLMASSLAAQPAVHLLSEVIVSSDSVHFADLLPSGTSPRLRAATLHITLGRSPQPGSFRVFTREQLLHKLGGQFQVAVPEQVVVRRLIPQTPANARATLPRRQTASPLVYPEVPASLVIERDAIRIHLRVLPLRKAALGEMVRVLDPASHRIFRAQVAGEGLLRIGADARSGEGNNR